MSINFISISSQNRSHCLTWKENKDIVHASSKRILFVLRMWSPRSWSIFNSITYFFAKLIEMKTKLGHIFARVVRDSTFSCWPEVYVQGQLQTLDTFEICGGLNPSGLQQQRVFRAIWGHSIITWTRIGGLGSLQRVDGM